MIRSEGTRATPRSRVILFLILAAVPMVILVGSIPAGHMLDEVVVDVVVLAAYGGIAGIVIFRRDGHLVGWPLLALGVTMLSVSRLEGFPGAPASLAGLVQSVGWPFPFSQFAVLTLVFPSGHLPVGNGRWAHIGRAMGRWLLTLLLVVTVLADSPDTTGAPNPLGFLPSWVWFSTLFGVVLILLGGAVSLVVRRRHSTGAERAQLGWVVLPLALLTVTILVALIGVLEALSRRLSNQVDLSELGRELQQLAHQTMQPATVTVWLREARR